MTKAEAKDLALKTELETVEFAVADAKDAKNRDALSIALERRDRLARSAGAQWLRRQKLRINGAQLARMIRFCALDDDAFERSLAANIKRTVAGLGYVPANAPPCSRIKSVISPWQAGPDGILTRTVTAVDEGAADAAAN
jgi:hypothetical protein